MKLCRNKTDKSDAKMIAAYGESENSKLWNPPSANIESCSAIEGVIVKYLREGTSHKNKLHSLESWGIKKGIVLNSLRLTIKRLTAEINKLEVEVQRLIEENEPELLSNLKSIPGIGTKTVTLLISKTEGFDKFENYRQVIAYVGLAPMEYSSGSSVRKRCRISKTGKPIVRNHLFLCAFTASQVNPQCMALYDRIVAKGKSKKLALIALSNKLIKQSFAIAKSGMPYNPDYCSLSPNF